MVRIPSPARVIDAVRRRGVAGASKHAVRKLGWAAERALIGPESIRINPLGHICNHACPMCFLQQMPPEELKRRKELDRTDALKLADYVALFDSMPSGLEEVNIVGGGEPLAHPQIVGIMEEIRRRGFRGSLISNGSLLKESIAKRMVEIRWNSTRISVHAGDAETYHRVQGADRFDIMKNNLKAFHRLRTEAGVRGECELIVFHVIQRENLGTIDKLFEFGEEVGADAMSFERVLPLDATMELTADELKLAEESFLSRARDCSVPCNAEAFLSQLRIAGGNGGEHKPFRPAARCSVGFDQAFITSMGDVLPCCFSSEVMGNVRQQPFREIWTNEQYSEFRRRLIQGKFARYCIESRCSLPGVLHN